jgi:hypothetical protein
VYRRAMLVDKKGKENFQSTEKEDGKGDLSKWMVRKFSQRARHYILAYFILRTIKKSILKVR